jgi:hypothetical protein
MLHLSEPEAWLLDEVVRHTFTEDGQPIGRELLKVFSVLREFRLAASRPFPPKELPLAVTESECWLIDYQINAARLQRSDPHSQRVARELLLKVFDLILAFQGDRVLGCPYETAAVADDAFDLVRRERLEEWQRVQRRQERHGDAPAS